MDRRLLLKLMAAAAATSCAPKADDNGQHVVVIGAGIIGASIAYHLSRAGAKVTVLDAAGPASQATRGNFAWINASWAKQPRHYHRLNQGGVAGWGALSRALNIPLSAKGSLEWFSDPARQDRLAVQIKEQAEWGEEARMIPAAQLSELESKVEFNGAASAAFSGNDAALDPIQATNALLAAAKKRGCVIDYPNRALAFDNGLVSTQTGNIKADHVVIATGADTDTPEKIGGLAIPQRSTPGLIVITAPMPKLIDHIIVAPGVHIHQRTDGRIVIGEQEGAPETHADRLRGRPIDFPETSFEELHKYMMIELAGEFIPALYDAEVEDIYIGWRPLPLDGHPVLGPSSAKQNVSYAISHSGVTLAPVIGQLMADMIVSGEAPEIFGDYRPDRDFENIKRY